MRRVLAVVLPEIALVLARRRVVESRDPIAVVVDPESAIVAAADASARRAGVRVGQGAAAATVRASGLRIVHVARGEIVLELERVLEVLSELGPTVAFRLEHELGEPDPVTYDDTAWVDVTGATALAGGEKALVTTAHARIDALGHRARVALASGPRIARALARWGEEPLVARNLDHERRLFSALPLHALPLSARAHTFFRRVGLASVGDLVALPRAQVSARLGDPREADPNARVVMGLLDLRDEVPLVPWTPARIVSEQLAFEDGVAGSEALVFVLRGMTSRLGQRLIARGEAAGKLVLSLALDRSIVRLARGEDAPIEVEIVIVLPVPLADPDALVRTLVPALDRTELAAPAIAMRLVAEEVTRARRDQLDLSRGRGIDPNRLKHLATELGVELGAGSVGFFRIHDAHRPELRSTIVLDGAAIRAALGGESPPNEDDALEALVPTRLLPEPVLVDRFVPGTRLVVGGRAHRVERVVSVARLEGVEWWTVPPAGVVRRADPTPGTPAGVTREYVRVSLVAEPSGERVEALVFHDRASQGSYLHGWLE